MSIYSDISEVRKLWASSSKSVKVGLVVSGFFAISSIASLSDIVFKWKGFFLDAYVFYKSYIVHYITFLLKPLGISLTERGVHFMVFFWLTVSARLRQQYRTKTSEYIFQQALIWISISGFVCWYILKISEPMSLFGVWNMFAIMIFLPFVSKMDKKDKFVYFAPIVLSLIIVGMMGAINAGLSRTI